MKKLFKYIGVLLSVALMCSLSACNKEKGNESADLGLGIKVFFPTKVVAGTSVSINGTGFTDATEVVFPDNVVVSNFQIVSDGMIRVVVPSGVSSQGGNLIVRTAAEEAESRLPLTMGNPVISGYSKQPGEEVQGGELLSIYGTDLEFLNSVELLDSDGNPEVIPDSRFYRKGTNTVIIIVPKKVYEGTFAGKVNTVNGQSFTMPELAYKPASEGGHWVTKKVPIWTNDNPEAYGSVSWSSTYRFALEGHDGNNECIAELPEDAWNIIKTGTFYLGYTVADPAKYQVRFTNGWWDTQWMGANEDVAPWAHTDLITDNGDGTFAIEVTFGNDPIVETLDQKHLLITGDGFTPMEIYYLEEVWEGDDPGPEEVLIWNNEDMSSVSWSSTYRFALEGHDGNNECIAEFPQDAWDVIKTGTFYLQYTVADPAKYQVRFTNGWWDTQWMGANEDVAPWGHADLITDNEDGTFSIVVTFGDDPLVETLDQKHLLITGDGFTPLKLYYLK